MLTPEELRQIRRLHVQAGRRVDSLLQGEYRSAFKGSGMEFDEVRPYVPGDEVRRIDWNVTARTGEPFVKTFKEERELTLLLLMDVSGSVRFGGGGRDGRTDKRLQLARAAGGLAFSALRSGDRVGLLTFTDKVEKYLPPRKSRGHGWQVIQAAFASSTLGKTNLATALALTRQVLKRRSVVVILSDFQAPNFEPDLAALARKHTTHALLVHDPLENKLPDLGLFALSDAEGGGVRTIGGGALDLAGPVDRRLKDLRRLGVRASPLSTAEDAFLRLQRHFAARGAGSATGDGGRG